MSARQILTPRQKEILAGISGGKSSKEIARELQISHATVKMHRTLILSRLRCHNMFAAVAKFSRSRA